MPPLSWSPDLLSADKLDRIHSAAVELAETVGLLVDHAGLLSKLAGQEGVRINRNRVHFRGDRIQAALEAMRFPPSPPPDEFAIIGGAYINIGPRHRYWPGPPSNPKRPHKPDAAWPATWAVWLPARAPVGFA